MREGANVYLLHQQGAGTAEALAVSLTVFAIQVLMASVGGLLQLSAAFKKPPSTIESIPDYWRRWLGLLAVLVILSERLASHYAHS